jgi:hypothetical protein
MIHCEKLTENLTLNLLDKVVYGVPVNKGPLFGIMSVQIKVES